MTNSIGSYNKEDAIFLLKDVSDLVQELSTAEREKIMQSGVHYSRVLPKESLPSEEYLSLFHDSVEKYAKDVALYVRVLADQIVRLRGLDNLVLVSLARAGTPVGVLLKRYIKLKYNTDVAHYSVSIIKGVGVDENAMKHIFAEHPRAVIQFVDGWTGKGSITENLTASCTVLNEKYPHMKLDPTPAVLADPANCTPLFGTREDIFIPSACLNATVSGLISRTVYMPGIIGEDDFHGAKYYKDWLGEDLSNAYVDRVSQEFESVLETTVEADQYSPEVTWAGMRDVNKIKEHLGLDSTGLIKPSVGETTRVLLRRVPWKILVRDLNDVRLEHILFMAQEKGVEVEVFPDMSYACCGIIRPMEKEE